MNTSGNQNNNPKDSQQQSPKIDELPPQSPPLSPILGGGQSHITPSLRSNKEIVGIQNAINDALNQQSFSSIHSLPEDDSFLDNIISIEDDEEINPQIDTEQPSVDLLTVLFSNLTLKESNEYLLDLLERYTKLCNYVTILESKLYGISNRLHFGKNLEKIENLFIYKKQNQEQKKRSSNQPTTTETGGINEEEEEEEETTEEPQEGQQEELDREAKKRKKEEEEKEKQLINEKLQKQSKQNKQQKGKKKKNFKKDKVIISDDEDSEEEESEESKEEEYKEFSGEDDELNKGNELIQSSEDESDDENVKNVANIESFKKLYATWKLKFNEKFRTTNLFNEDRQEIHKLLMSFERNVNRKAIKRTLSSKFLKDNQIIIENKFNQYKLDHEEYEKNIKEKSKKKKNDKKGLKSTSNKDFPNKGSNTSKENTSSNSGIGIAPINTDQNQLDFTIPTSPNINETPEVLPPSSLSTPPLQTNPSQSQPSQQQQQPLSITSITDTDSNKSSNTEIESIMTPRALTLSYSNSSFINELNSIEQNLTFGDDISIVIEYVEIDHPRPKFEHVIRSLKIFEKFLEEKVKMYGISVENFGVQLKLLKNNIKQIEQQYIEEYNKKDKSNLEPLIQWALKIEMHSKVRYNRLNWIMTFKNHLINIIEKVGGDLAEGWKNIVVNWEKKTFHSLNSKIYPSAILKEELKFFKNVKYFYLIISNTETFNIYNELKEIFFEVMGKINDIVYNNNYKNCEFYSLFKRVQTNIINNNYKDWFGYDFLIEIRGYFQSLLYQGPKEFEIANSKITCYVQKFENLFNLFFKILKYQFTKSNLIWGLEAVELIKDNEVIALSQNIINEPPPPFPFKISFTDRVLKDVPKNLMSQFTILQQQQQQQRPIKPPRIRRIDPNRNDDHYLISLSTITSEIKATTTEDYVKELFERLENYFQIKKSPQLFILRFIYLLRKIASGNPLKILDINLKKAATDITYEQSSNCIISDENTLAVQKGIFYIGVTLFLNEVIKLYNDRIIPPLETTNAYDYIQLRFGKGYSPSNVKRKETLAQIFEVYPPLIIFANIMQGKLITKKLVNAIRIYRDQNGYEPLTSNLLNLRNAIRHLAHFQNNEYVRVKLNNSIQFNGTIVGYNFNGFHLQVYIKKAEGDEELIVYCENVEKPYEYEED
ncbi:hypothetical protein ABK040_012980 [Willaertia magna]